MGSCHSHTSSQLPIATLQPPSPIHPRPLQNHPITLQHFQIIGLVGEGGFGRVFKVRMNDNGQIYAMKVFVKSRLTNRVEYASVVTERDTLLQLHFSLLPRLHFAFQTPSALCLVMDYYAGGSLAKRLEEGRLSEAAVAFYCAEVVLCLEYLHAQQLVYRDLKPANVVLDEEGHAHLVDFGLCKRWDVAPGEKKRWRKRRWSTGGTEAYLAPEVRRRGEYDMGVDWWALGVMMWELLTGDTPSVVAEDAASNARLSKPQHMSMCAFNACYRLLETEEQRRLGCGGSEEVKEHPFFRDLDWEALRERRVCAPWKPCCEEVVDGSWSESPTEWTVEDFSFSESRLC